MPRGLPCATCRHCFAYRSQTGCAEAVSLGGCCSAAVTFGLPLGLEAPVMTPNGVIFSFSFSFLFFFCSSHLKMACALDGSCSCKSSRCSSPRIPQPLKSVVGSLPWKPIVLQWGPYLIHHTTICLKRKMHIVKLQDASQGSRGSLGDTTHSSLT